MTKIATTKPARARKAATEPGQGARKPKHAPKPRASQKAAPSAATPKQRAPSKQAALIEMLRAPDGASISEISDAFGWLPHTTRAAVSAGLRKKLGLDVQSERVAGRGTVYRLPA